MKLLAIDGNSLINRAFYGIKLLTTKDGQYTNAVYGFINILHRLEELEAPDGVVVAFDLKAPTFRHKMYTGYKAGRKGMPEELRSQMPILKEWLTLAGYTCVECEGYEADDILGTLACACEQSGNECVISTGDRDSLQLISDSTRVLLAATKMGKPEIINYNKEALFEKYGLTPEEMIELKALQGDSSDNIPGVAGVGEKTATDLISRFHNIDYIYENIETIDIKDGVRNKLIADKTSAFLSRDLGRICKTAPINENIADYKRKPMNEAELARLMTRLEFFKLLDKMGLKADNSPIITSKADLATITVSDTPLFTDTATVYCENGSFAVVSGNCAFTCDESTVKQLFENQKISKKVYDYKNIYKNFSGILNVQFDALLAAYLCNPSASSYAMDRLFAEYSAKLPEIKGEANELIKNACLFDSVCQTLEKELDKSGQLKLLYDIEIPLAKVLGDMELRGFKADKAGLERMSQELGVRTQKI